MPPTHPTPRRPVRRALGVAGSAAVVTALLAGFGATGAAAVDPATVTWEDGSSSGRLTIVLDGDTLDPGEEVGAQITWTYLGPTQMADDGEDPLAACEAALGSTYERSVSASVPPVLLGTSGTLSDYRLDDEAVVGPVAAVLRPADGVGTERIRPERCLDDGTPIARTVRDFRATYTIPSDLPDGAYAALVADPGYDRWWTDGDAPVVAVGQAGLPPGATTSTVAVGDGSAPSTVVGGTDASTAPGAETSAETSADDTSTTTPPGGATATTAPGAAEPADGAAPADGADGSTPTTIAGRELVDAGDEPSAGRLAVDVARTGLAVLGAIGALAATWKSRQQPPPAQAERLRMLTSLGALMALAGVGLSLLVASFDSPFVIGLLGLALAVLPQPAVRRVAGPGLTPATRGRPARPTRSARHPKPATRPTRSTGRGGGTHGQRVLEQDLPPGASVEDVRRMLERSRSDDR